MLRRVAAGAGEWLAPGGHLLSETSEAQLDAAVGVLRAAGLAPRSVSSAELEANVVIGQQPKKSAQSLHPRRGVGRK